jgi:hypothetical protein
MKPELLFSLSKKIARSAPVREDGDDDGGTWDGTLTLTS